MAHVIQIWLALLLLCSACTLEYVDLLLHRDTHEHACQWLSFPQSICSPVVIGITGGAGVGSEVEIVKLSLSFCDTFYHTQLHTCTMLYTHCSY